MFRVLCILALLPACTWTATTAVLPGEPADLERLHLQLCDDDGVCIDPGVLVFVTDHADQGPAFVMSTKDAAKTSALQEKLSEMFPDFTSFPTTCEGHSNNVWLCTPSTASTASP